ncbi:hypothetical protein Y032_0024g1034 [Ancylostoma ceylanicum]|uniref:Protein kinase domain-containing protein n=1 Tax=Ancylostoma ceylanicum TaxID=53326 RepID=A0A016UXZ0_9BILA|nr:hypothetical protein Y032_0024g1034 [Ancylostoma ceylanicum]
MAGFYYYIFQYQSLRKSHIFSKLEKFCSTNLRLRDCWPTVDLHKFLQYNSQNFRVPDYKPLGLTFTMFRAIHEDTQTRWAVKIESEKCDRKRMKLEIMVLMLLRGKANIPEIVAMGTCPTGHFIILELVGRNLSDLRRQLPRRRISSSSLYRSMLQVRR